MFEFSKKFADSDFRTLLEVQYFIDDSIQKTIIDLQRMGVHVVGRNI
jgi:hypothetical protein